MRSKKHEPVVWRTDDQARGPRTAWPFATPLKVNDNSGAAPALMVQNNMVRKPGPRQTILRINRVGEATHGVLVVQRRTGLLQFRRTGTRWLNHLERSHQRARAEHLRGIKKGDKILFYHTGDEKAVVGVMEATADPIPDPEDEAGKRVVVAVKPLRKLKNPVTLAAIKARQIVRGMGTGPHRPALGDAGARGVVEEDRGHGEREIANPGRHAHSRHHQVVKSARDFQYIGVRIHSVSRKSLSEESME